MDPNGMDNGEDRGTAGQEAAPFLTLKFAPAWKRALAFLIDSAIIMAVIMFMASFIYARELQVISAQTDVKLQFSLSQQFAQAHSLEISLALFVLACGFFVLGWTGNGQTLGGRILKIAVITMDSRRLGLFQALIRFALIYLSAMAYFIPVLFVLNPVYHQRIMDFFTGSVVVETPEGNFNKWNNREDNPDNDDVDDQDTY